MEILGTVAIVAITGALILWPLLRQDVPHPDGSPVQSTQDRARTAALAAIRELEFDFQTGKISPEDYKVLRARYEVKAVEAIAEGPERAGRVEGAVAQSTAERNLDVDIEALVSAARATRYCTACGEPLPSAANFCPACGAVAGAAGPERVRT